MSCRYSLVSGYLNINLPGIGGPNTVIRSDFFCHPYQSLPDDLKHMLACGNMEDGYTCYNNNCGYGFNQSNYAITNRLAALEVGQNPLLYHHMRPDLPDNLIRYDPFISFEGSFAYYDWKYQFIRGWNKTWLDSAILYDSNPPPEDRWQYYMSAPGGTPIVVPSPIIPRLDNVCGIYNQWFSKIKNFPYLEKFCVSPLPNRCFYSFLSGFITEDEFGFLDLSNVFECQAVFQNNFTQVDCYHNGQKYATGHIDFYYERCS